MHQYNNYHGRPYRGTPPFRPFPVRQNQPSSRLTHADLLNGLSDKLAVIIPPDEEQLDPEEIKVEGFKTVGSYNRVDGIGRPSLIVPGEPPIWCPPDTSFKATADSLPDYAGHSRTSNSSWPKTLIQSVKAFDPAFDLGSADVLTIRNNLRKVLRFAMGTFTHDWFRINAQLVGDTMVLMRWEASDSSGVYSGYGTSFRKTCTTVVREDAPLNHRTVAHELGGLKFVIGSHVDGQVVDDNGFSTEHGFDIQKEIIKTTGTDELATLLGDLSVEQPESEAPIDSPVHYVRDGTLCPDSTTLELRTLSSLNQVDYLEAYVMMYLTQTSYLVVARHTRGYFKMPPETRALNDPFFRAHKAELQEALKKFIVVLKEMKEAMRSHASNQPVAFVFGGSLMEMYDFKKPGSVRLPWSLTRLFETPTEA